MVRHTNTGARGAATGSAAGHVLGSLFHISELHKRCDSVHGRPLSSNEVGPALTKATRPAWSGRDHEMLSTSSTHKSPRRDPLIPPCMIKEDFPEFLSV
ncbi:jg24538 [Pararge aegeria aegeria]|uniref:Jg24538 protein n=1 Tax=Pararge aegeria aegeria TaxID=348720 RepID=A0A8S4QPQ4_9NEOP|nr:jg24538 [Pararge aegeria aegeria]